MAKSTGRYVSGQPMRIQARKGSLAESEYFLKSALPGRPWPMPKAIAPGISPSPLDDLIFHGGKIVPQMVFQNIYLGSHSDWPGGDIDSINAAITTAMRDVRLNNVIVQYFHNATLSCDVQEALVLTDPKPDVLDEPDVQAKILQLVDPSNPARSDLDRTIFNLILPPGTELRLGTASSRQGLGGYHGSVHVKKGGKDVTLYYSANVYSQMVSQTEENGIVAFDAPWKNVVATLYHELNEFRTDTDVHDAIQSRDNDLLGWMSRKGHECGDQPIFVASSLNLVFQEILAASGGKRIPVQFMYSNAVHGAEGPINNPHA
jgi:hypothetical protein